VRNAPSRFADFVDTYTRDLKAEDLQRLFTRDTRDAYKFFTRGSDDDKLRDLPWHRRLWWQIRLLFTAFTMRLSPARRIVYGAALLLAVLGLLNLFRGFELLRLAVGPIGPIPLPMLMPVFRSGTWSLLVAFALMNLLVLLEVADRLSLKNDLEIARQIQQAMLPDGVYEAPGVETIGITRPANTVGGDFYDILPLGDGRVVVAVGDVAGKGSPAALLMALLLAMLRTLVDERLEPPELVARLNVQVTRHAPGTRFITLFYAVYDAATGELTFVNAGHTPPLLIRNDGTVERLLEGGIALGMFPSWGYTSGQVIVEPGEMLAVYSDGITEAENPSGRPFDEEGLQGVLAAHRAEALSAIGAAVVRDVEAYSADSRLADDLTILLLRRRTAPAVVGV
jgi:serine phosphatase RsbU (regulator of sigma subunit)